MNLFHRSESECEFVGVGMADIAGIGIMVGFVGQAFMSLLLASWVFFLSRHGNLDRHHEQNSVAGMIEVKRLKTVSEILMTGNNIQMLLGGAYMITVFVSWKTIDLYHLHLAFDVVSFVGVSNAAAFMAYKFCAVKVDSPDSPVDKRHDPRSYKSFEARSTYIFSILFLGLTILLGIRLDDWNVGEKPRDTGELEHMRGRCYHANLIVADSGSHPSADKTYVAITASWLLLVMASALIFGAKRRRAVLVLAFLQFPVHLYMALALRQANQGHLEEEENENNWDFGQTTAVVLLAIALNELISKGKEYIEFERNLKKYGPHSVLHTKKLGGRAVTNLHELAAMSRGNEDTVNEESRLQQIEEERTVESRE